MKDDKNRDSWISREDKGPRLEIWDASKKPIPFLDPKDCKHHELSGNPNQTGFVCRTCNSPMAWNDTLKVWGLK